MSYICHIMNVVPPCETSNSEMRSPCETYTAKPCSQCNAGAPGPRDARDALANRCWASTSLDVSGCLWSCAVLSWMQHVRSARIHLCRRHFHFFHFFPATRNLLPCCYPLPCLFTDRTCGETFPSSKSMVDAWRLKAITLTFPPAQTKLTLR